MKLSELADATELPMRTLRRWCVVGQLRASRFGGKLWYVDLHALKSSADASLTMLWDQVVEARFSRPSE